jgi:hypoxanthine phosphoribosyltransferase
MIQIKIGLCGTNGRGKTTKAIDLMEHYTFLGNKVLIVDDVVRSCPHLLLHTLETIEAQEEIWAMQMAAEKAAMAQDVDVIICDRTVMDNLMYYFDIIEDNDQKGINRWRDLYMEAKEWMPTYDQVIRLPLNLEYLKADDPIRPKDVAYVRRIDVLFDRFMQPYVKDE